MLTFLLVIHAVITATLVGVILMQRSEGGGLGMGGSPTGLMSARGAADFLTRATTILASLFVLLSIVSAVIASRSTLSSTIDTSLARRTATPVRPAAPANTDPLAAVAGAAGNDAVPGASAPVPVAVAPAPTTKAEPQKTAKKPVEKRTAPEAVPKAVVPTTPARAPAPTPAPSTPPANNGN